MPDAPVGAAIIGCGLIGFKRARALSGARLAACADLYVDRASSLAAAAPGAAVYGDWRQAVLHDGVQVVIVATTNDALAEVTRFAVENGRHVLVEKPAARTPAELDPVIAAARQHNCLVRVGFNHRYHPALLKAQELFRAGALGEMMFVRGRYGHGGRTGYDREWRANKAMSGGGELLDQGVHLIDLARLFLGDFTRVSGHAQTYFWDMPVDDNGFMLLHTAAKKTAFLHVSCSEWKNLFSLEIYGRQAKLHIEGLGGSYGVERLSYYQMLPQMGPPDTTIWEYPRGDDSWALEFKEFLTDIRLQRTPSAGLADARAALAVVETIYREFRPMIITRSPLRITLGGGGTDLPSYYRSHGGFLIAAAIQKYVYVSVMRPFVPGIFLKYSRLEHVEQVSEVQHPIIREALDMLNFRTPQVEITTLADIPSGTGLGSSGSFSTALLKALYTHRKRLLLPSELARLACEIEIERLGEPVGKQDQYIAAYGGITCFTFNPDETVDAIPLKISMDTLYDLEDNLLLFFTGFARSAGSILKDQDQRTRQMDSSMIENLHYVKEMGFRTRQALESGQTTQFGEIMHEHWEHKRQRSPGMSNPQIDEWYALGRKNGAVGGKLVGAGGGGFLMFYAENRKSLRQAMCRAGLEEVRFNFDFEGTKVLFGP